MSKTKDAKPLTLADTLRDLARLRASDFDPASLLPHNTQSVPSSGSTVDRSVEESYKFTREARAALKIHNRNDVSTQGARVEDVRTKLDELAAGLDSGTSCEKSLYRPEEMPGLVSMWLIRMPLQPEILTSLPIRTPFALHAIEKVHSEQDPERFIRFYLRHAKTSKPFVVVEVDSGVSSG
ncbi:hypothetical protein H0H87_001422 [Tephrocybe sp. NHM501043]|nr:hypothetical protein H0H87_001422 [Tephrocybe sp. NHM501043]